MASIQFFSASDPTSGKLSIRPHPAGGTATSLLKDKGSSTDSAATKNERNLPDNTEGLASLGTGRSSRHLFFWNKYFSLSEGIYVSSAQLAGLPTSYPWRPDPCDGKAPTTQANADCVLASIP